MKFRNVEIIYSDMGVMNDYANAVELFLCEDVRNLPSPLIEEFVTLFFAVSFYFPEARTMNNFVSVNTLKLQNVSVLLLILMYADISIGYGNWR